MNIITVEEVREWFENADADLIQDFIYEGLGDLIEELEEDDFFGTEGFNKRFA